MTNLRSVQPRYHTVVQYDTGRIIASSAASFDVPYSILGVFASTAPSDYDLLPLYGPVACYGLG